jgi:hypothetical protein
MSQALQYAVRHGKDDPQWFRQQGEVRQRPLSLLHPLIIRFRNSCKSYENSPPNLKIAFHPKEARHAPLDMTLHCILIPHSSSCPIP